MNPEAEQRQVDLLITTALTEEARVVEAVLGHVAIELAEVGDVTYYHYAIGSRTVCIATASAHRMGAVDMGLFATALFTHLAPRSATLVGIAAAVDMSEVHLGDVPFASQVISYDDIAVDAGAITFRTAGYPTDPSMHRAAGRLRTRPRHYSAWQADCLSCVEAVREYLNALRRVPVTLPPGGVGQPHLVVEIVAGGPFLIRDQGFRDSLRTQPAVPSSTLPVSAPVHPKLVSAEMESHGFMRAAHQHGIPATVLKGISDVGDKDKAALEKETGGFFRAYACSNATLAALHILRRVHADDDDGRQVVSVIDAATEMPRDGGAQPRRAHGQTIDAADARLADAILRRERLRALGESTEDIANEIRQLKREMRRGGTLRRGDILGERYVICKRLGSGGFATVWQARDHRTGDDVAVKVLHGEHAGNPVTLSRFRRGARIMMELAHQSIVAIRDECIDDDGYHFFAMDYATGGDLHGAVLTRGLAGAEPLELIRPIASALSYAHARGFTHRDVKPSNILLGSSNQPYLADFDLVAGFDTTGGTRTGALGTVVYAAPEMLDRPQDAGPPADIYGFGMTVVFLLAARDLELSIIRDIEGFVDSLGCSWKLRQVLKRCLAWKADERYQDAGELADALDRLHSLSGGGDGAQDSYLETRTGIKFVGILEELADEVPVAAQSPAMYWIGETAVTNRQYRMFLDDIGLSGEVHGLPDAPVVKVSHYDALRFCEWLTALIRRRVSLPTAAQWRYAATGRSQRLYPWGDEPPSKSRCQYRFNYGEQPLEVGSLPGGRGLFGTLDQSGGVWEWCVDRGASAPASDDKRLACGGSFATSAYGVRLDSTIERYARHGFCDVGFRVVISQPGPRRR